jgi:hypothetical protein
MSILERDVITTDKPAELDEVGRILVRAAEIVRERGLAKGVFESITGSVCAEGAIAYATNGTWNPDDDCQAVSRLHASLGGTLGATFKFNDHPDRTAEEVAEALERAAYLP